MPGAGSSPELHRPACISRRALLASGLALGAGFALSACGAASPAAPATERKRITLSWWTDTGYPSPFTFSSLGPGGVVKETMLFDTLVWKDASGLIPWLARSWDVLTGGREIVFHLRTDVTWHDGHPFTAEDVAFSFDYFGQHPYAWADLSSVSGASAIDSRTVALKFRQPFAPALHDIAGVLPMIPRHVWSSVSDPLRFDGPGAVVGTGPYRFHSYAAGQGAYLLVANGRFFRGRPAFKELAYALMPEAQQPLGLSQGRVDAALSTNYEVQQRFQGGRYRVLKTPPFSIVRLVFNVDRAPFNRREFRHAIAYALDRAQIAERVIHGDVIVGNPGVIPPGSPWYQSDVTQYPYDPGRARSLLDAIGYDRSTRVQLLADPADQDAQLVQSMLGQVGIQIDVVTADPKTRTARLKQLDYQMGLLKHIGVGGDPDFLRRWYAGKAFNAFEQGNVLHNDEFSRLADEQSQEMNSTRRHALVDRMQAILADELPTLALYHRRFYYIYDPSVWSRWFNTWAGIMTGIPLVDNKLALVAG